MIRRQTKSFLKAKQQTGTFVVEFAAMAIALGMVLAFCGDTIVRISTKGKLDRMAYSAVSIIKERTNLFDGNDFQTTDQQQFDDLSNIVKGSLSRTLFSFDPNMFGMALEVQKFDEEQNPLTLITQRNAEDEGIACTPSPVLDDTLSVTTSQGGKASIYRVTLCYQTINWFGAVTGREYGLVSSNAVAIGR